MKDLLDVVRGWVRKADSDLAVVDLALDAGRALDTACFHAQQAAEKLLKAYLTFKAVEFPFTHNLSKLLDLCQAQEPGFQQLRGAVEPLTPYAVAMRYDQDFWPTAADAGQARDAARALRAFVLELLPPEIGQPA